MSALKKYLEDNHENPDKLKEDFQLKFGVNVRKEGEHYLFKYGIIQSNWKEQITRECRGSILKLSNNGWDFLSRPWDKFFNQHEGYCPLFEPTKFNKQLNDSVLLEKADGTAIQLWNDGKQWRVSTLGSIIPKNVQDSNITFSELFWKTVGTIHLIELDTSFTYLFELCCDENRIVTKYKKNHAVYLGARDRRSGGYLQFEELLYDINMGAFRDANIRLPHLIDPLESSIKTLNDVKTFIENASNDENYGKWSEGFVLYDKNYFHPIAKLKNSRYVSLHSVGGGDIAHSKNQIIDAIFLGHIDDIYEVLSDRLKVFADDIKKSATDLQTNVNKTALNIQRQHFPTRKSFAAFIKDCADKRVQGFFFQNANQFMKNDINNISDKFEIWLKDNYKKFEWKNE